MNPAVYFAFIFLGTAAMVVLRLSAIRSDWSRMRLRRTYTRESPIWIRHSFSLLPVWAPGLFTLSLAAIVPRDIALWPVPPALLLFQLAFLLSYRVPVSLMPNWLRDEIGRGVTPEATPDRLDWLLLWIVLPVFVSADVGFIFVLTR